MFKLDDLLKIDENEKPLDRIPENGGLTAIFRNIVCIGDSLASGEFESIDENGGRRYHDCYPYSWGQFIGRMTGAKVYNFSAGGMTAKHFYDFYAVENDFWSRDKLAEAYIIALGVNDLLNQNQEIGDVSDIDLQDRDNNRPSFAGYYAKIIQKIKSIRPGAKIFLVTMPLRSNDMQRKDLYIGHAKLLHDMAKFFTNTYVVDLNRYLPVYDDEFKEKYYLKGHMSPAGYYFTALVIAAYIDYIIRHNPNDFKQIGLIGTPYIEKECL